MKLQREKTRKFFFFSPRKSDYRADTARLLLLLCAFPCARLLRPCTARTPIWIRYRIWMPEDGENKTCGPLRNFPFFPSAVRLRRHRLSTVKRYAFCAALNIRVAIAPNEFGFSTVTMSVQRFSRTTLSNRFRLVRNITNAAGAPGGFNCLS